MATVIAVSTLAANNALRSVSISTTFTHNGTCTMAITSAAPTKKFTATAALRLRSWNSRRR